MSDRWYKNHRLEWIAEMLRIYGFINREHVMRKFGISTPQASKDLNDFQKKNPNAVSYDLSVKKFIARDGRKI
jgi:DeoR/GlpR family transcriptional regulator of sugar metabolism